MSGCVGAAMMNLAEAKDCFEDLVRRLAKKDVTPFLDWLQDNWFSEQVGKVFVIPSTCLSLVLSLKLLLCFL